MEMKITCPLGSQCEEIKDNVLCRCAWYTKLVGKDPQSQKEYDEWRCAIAWFPIMQVEVSQTNRGNQEAVISLRDEMIKRQDVVNNIIAIAAAKAGKIRKEEIAG
jgi:hypothetical protein